MIRLFCAGTRVPRVGGHTQLSLPTPKLGPPWPRIARKLPGGPGTVRGGLVTAWGHTPSLALSPSELDLGQQELAL